MKIGFFVTQVACAAGFENTVSAHVQLPLYLMKLLMNAGHTVHLITNEFSQNSTFPNCLPEGAKVMVVSDGRRRGKGFVMEVGYRKGVYPVKFLKQLFEIRRIIRDGQYDVFHFFGSSRMAYLAGMMKGMGIKTPLALTINCGKVPEFFWFAKKYLWKQLDLVITSTEFFGNQCAAQGIRAEVIKHGIVRPIVVAQEDRLLSSPRRVLFWRDPSV
ncbi:MAG TPA: glycosyltransferase, partial [Smithella sp.]|nr:glycosyltransferase [Smithella sp.]